MDGNIPSFSNPKGKIPKKIIYINPNLNLFQNINNLNSSINISSNDTNNNINNINNYINNNNTKNILNPGLTNGIINIIKSHNNGINGNIQKSINGNILNEIKNNVINYDVNNKLDHNIGINSNSYNGMINVNQNGIRNLNNNINNGFNKDLNSNINGVNNLKNYGIYSDIATLLNGYKKNGFTNLPINYNINDLLNEQIKNEIKNLYFNAQLTNNIYKNHYPSNINDNLGQSMNANDLNNFYKIYNFNNPDSIQEEINPYRTYNLSSNIYQNINGNNLFYLNNHNNINNIQKINNNNFKNDNYQYNKIYNNNTINNIDFLTYNNNLNFIDISAQLNGKLNSQLNNNILNHEYNHNLKNINNHNHSNINNHNNKEYNNKKDSIAINEKDLSDEQIDFLFSQLYNLPKEVCLLLFIINKKGVTYFIRFIKTLKGSKYLQNILITNPPKESEIDYITKIICYNYKEIMCDYYGNYFLQKFFPFCNYKNRIDILNSIKSDFINIANDICGNHSLQCLILLENTNEEKEIIRRAIQANLKELWFGGNSSHVISKLIKCIKESDRQYINSFIINNLMDLCIDSNGICIIKEFIYNIKSNFYIKLIICTFEKETNKLTLNQFGNFIIQEAIKYFGYNYCKNIINILIKNIVKFSVSKFSSNVIDFLLEYLSKKEFYKFCIAIKKIFLKESNFKEMIKNKFSIYVIENSLELLIKINENYFINAMKNNLGNNFHNKKNKNSKNKDVEEKSDSDEEINNDSQNGEFSYQNFCKLKKQIFQFIENNSAEKEKKKILLLIKENKYKNI